MCAALLSQDSVYKYYEVIMVDPMHKVIRGDPRINWICSPVHVGSHCSHIFRNYCFAFFQPLVTIRENVVDTANRSTVSCAASLLPAGSIAAFKER
jgi:hypothetical protein